MTLRFVDKQSVELIEISNEAEKMRIGITPNTNIFHAI